MCGCKKGHGVSLHGAGVRRKRGGMSISGAGYKKRKHPRRKKRRKGGGWGTSALMFGPMHATLSAVAGAALGRKKASGGRFLSGATWGGYGKKSKGGSGMSVAGAGLYGKRLLGRGGSGRRQI
jgi:hypothetical protein